MERAGLKEWIQGLFSRIWYLRGIAAAFTLLAFLEEILPLERAEILRFVRAVLAQWAHIPAALSDLTAYLPLIPKLDRISADLVMLYAATFGPTLIIMLVGGKHGRGMLSILLQTDRELFPHIKNARIWSGTTALRALSFVTAWTMMFFLMAAVVAPIPLARMGIDWSQKTPVLGIAMVAPFVVTAVFWLYVSLKGIPRFRRGFVYSLSFVATLELLRLAQLPVVADTLNAWSCATLGEVYPGC
ncbi:hypothetical protein CKO28_13685 [Rhodovibrio sodomensis]|uniref:YihY/virulence factor BrkB family protein n=1 Tax=Rhodovibrio sodomensis TaxID=1088 RepID=A0ABS1DF45_9PROT|nr:hypothetical protein [Rhodovibrio sodomensis]MBK1669085.1 hypothetical protein [Rhodovibrio sodomensis]